MGYSRYDPAMQSRHAWNAGKAVGIKRPITQKQIWAVRFLLDHEGRLRDRALFDLAIDSKLRGCDLVKIKIGELVANADLGTKQVTYIPHSQVLWILPRRRSWVHTTRQFHTDWLASEKDW